MKILYEDNEIIVCEKPVGVISQHAPDGSGVEDFVKMKYGYGAVINRLDTAVGGTLLLAKTPSMASKLNTLSANRQIDKSYMAVVEGEPSESTGIFEDLLFKDSSKNKSFVVKRERKGVKKASLEYEVVETVRHFHKPLTLVKIKLHTGRTHQIRVQFSSRKMPLCGDGKYGSKDNRCSVSLWCCGLSFPLPATGEVISVESAFPDAYPWNVFLNNQ